MICKPKSSNFFEYRVVFFLNSSKYFLCLLVSLLTQQLQHFRSRQCCRRQFRFLRNIFPLLPLSVLLLPLNSSCQMWKSWGEIFCSKVFLWPHIKSISLASYQKYFRGLVLTKKRNIRPKKDKRSQQLDKQPAVVGKKQKFLCRGKSSKNWVGIVVAWCQVNPSTPPTANFFARLLVLTKSAILIYILCNGCSPGDQTCWRCSENATFRNLPTFVVHWLQQIWGNCGGIKRSGTSPQPTHWGVPNPLNADGRREGGLGNKRQKHVLWGAKAWCGVIVRMSTLFGKSIHQNTRLHCTCWKDKTGWRSCSVGWHMEVCEHTQMAFRISLGFKVISTHNPIWCHVVRKRRWCQRKF